MEDTFGPISETPLAFYDHDTSYWRMSQGTLAWVPPQSLEILPASGMTHNGQLFERPTLGHHTSDNAGFALLPTPITQGHARNRTSGRHAESQHHSGTTLPDLAWIAAGKAFSEPTGQLSNNGKSSQDV